MTDTIASYVEWKSRTNRGGSGVSAAPDASPRAPEANEERHGFSKVFRWPVPSEQKPQPTSVEVVGSFTDWRKVAMVYDKATKTWQAVLRNIKGNHTHQYVILIDGKPSYDKNCDGLAAPQSPEEQQWQIPTARGPRVMLLFAQTK